MNKIELNICKKAWLKLRELNDTKVGTWRLIDELGGIIKQRKIFAR